MPVKPRAPWKERFTFLESAEREFLRLPESAQRDFFEKFQVLARHPWTASRDLDVQPLREMPGRWRLKVEGGHRGVYRSNQGRPDFEMFETREAACNRLHRYIGSRA